MNLNIDSIEAKEEAWERYIYDYGVNVSAPTETNCALHYAHNITRRNFTRASYNCRLYGNIKGGGGGGAARLVHHGIPCLNGYATVTSTKN